MSNPFEPPDDIDFGEELFSCDVCGEFVNDAPNATCFDCQDEAGA